MLENKTNTALDVPDLSAATLPSQPVEGDRPVLASLRNYAAAILVAAQMINIFNTTFQQNQDTPAPAGNSADVTMSA